MFKKFEIWILYVAILLSIIFAVGFGALVRQELVGNVKAGWISKTALVLAEIPMNFKTILAGPSIDLVVEDRFPNSNGFDGVPVENEAYLLLSRYDGSLQEGVVELVDLTNFRVLHTWNPDIDGFNKKIDEVGEWAYLDQNTNNKRFLLTHPKLTKDGGLLFQYFYAPLRKIDVCSNLIFQNTNDQFHHSIETDTEGNIWVPSHLFPQTLPVEKVGRGSILKDGYLDVAIVKLSQDGKILYEKSVSEIFIENGLEYLLFATGNGYDQDPIHLNDIQPVNFDGEFWQKGDVFLSLRSQSMVLLYRPSTNEIVWSRTGPFFRQHDVDILDEQSISIFNNNAKDFVNGEVVDGHNEVIIYDFKNDKYDYYLNESLERNEVRTKMQGRSEILPNNDLFVEETNYGRTLYFNADGSLRWTHVNRAENGKVYTVGWSRILYTQDDLNVVNKFLEQGQKCNE